MLTPPRIIKHPADVIHQKVDFIKYIASGRHVEFVDSRHGTARRQGQHQHVSSPISFISIPYCTTHDKHACAGKCRGWNSQHHSKRSERTKVRNWQQTKECTRLWRLASAVTRDYESKGGIGTRLYWKLPQKWPNTVLLLSFMCISAERMRRFWPKFKLMFEYFLSNTENYQNQMSEMSNSQHIGPGHRRLWS